MSFDLAASSTSVCVGIVQQVLQATSGGCVSAKYSGRACGSFGMDLKKNRDAIISWDIAIVPFGSGRKKCEYHCSSMEDCEHTAPVSVELC